MKNTYAYALCVTLLVFGILSQFNFLLTGRTDSASSAAEPPDPKFVSSFITQEAVASEFGRVSFRLRSQSADQGDSVFNSKGFGEVRLTAQLQALQGFEDSIISVEVGLYDEAGSRVSSTILTVSRDGGPWYYASPPAAYFPIQYITTQIPVLAPKMDFTVTGHTFSPGARVVLRAATLYMVP
jgi:hypothetical protein